MQRSLFEDVSVESCFGFTRLCDLSVGDMVDVTLNGIIDLWVFFYCVIPTTNIRFYSQSFTLSKSSGEVPTAGLPSLLVEEATWQQVSTLGADGGKQTGPRLFAREMRSSKLSVHSDGIG